MIGFLMPLVVTCLTATTLTMLGTVSPISISVLVFALSGSPGLAIAGYISSLLAMGRLEIQEMSTNTELLYTTEANRPVSNAITPSQLLCIKSMVLVMGLTAAFYFPTIPFRVPALVSIPVIGYFLTNTWLGRSKHIKEDSGKILRNALMIGIPVAVTLKVLSYILPSFNPAIALLISLSCSALLVDKDELYSRESLPVTAFDALWRFSITIIVSLVCPGVGVGISSSITEPGASQVNLAIANLAVESYVLGSCLFGMGSSKTMLGSALQSNWLPNVPPEFLSLLPAIILGAIAMNYLLVALPLTPKRSKSFLLLISAMLVIQGILSMGPAILIFIIVGVALNNLLPAGLRPLLILLVAV